MLRSTQATGGVLRCDHRCDFAAGVPTSGWAQSNITTADEAYSSPIPMAVFVHENLFNTDIYFYKESIYFYYNLREASTGAAVIWCIGKYTFA